MATTEPADLQRARKASERALLAIEAAALLRLRSTVRGVVTASPAASAAGLVETSHRLEDAVAADVLRARTAARRDSRARFADELVAATGQPLDTAPIRNDDEAAAAQVGKAYSAAWLSQAIAAQEPSSRPAMLGAVDATDYRIKSIAVTEVSKTFNDERERVGVQYARKERSRIIVVPLKIWWATLDRTCPRCTSLHGTIRPFGIPFPGGAVPGAVHPNCNCYESVTAIGFEKDREEAA